MLLEWDIPTSYGDALERRRMLIADIQAIQAQLGDRNKRRAAVGSHERQTEYFDWRTKAIWACTNRLEELRLVKKWINDYRDEHDPEPVESYG